MGVPYFTPEPFLYLLLILFVGASSPWTLQYGIYVLEKIHVKSRSDYPRILLFFSLATLAYWMWFVQEYWSSMAPVFDSGGFKYFDPNNMPKNSDATVYIRSYGQHLYRLIFLIPWSVWIFSRWDAPLEFQKVGIIAVVAALLIIAVSVTSIWLFAMVAPVMLLIFASILALAKFNGRQVGDKKSHRKKK